MLQLKTWSRVHSFCVICAAVLVILYFVSDSIPIGIFTKNNINRNSDIDTSPFVVNKHNSYDRLNALIEKNKNSLEDNPQLLKKNGYNYHKSGAGIVFAATLDSLPFIYVSISILQYLNITSYPIEIYLNQLDGKSEKDIMATCNKYFDTFVGISIHCKFCHHDPLEYALSSYPALYLLDSSFQHVLYLDFYNVIIQNPHILFDSDEYNLNRAIFWPNKCEQPTQLVMDTVFYHNMLNIVIDCYNSNKYPWRDCFRLMWLDRHETFYFLEIQPQYIGVMTNDTFYATSLFQFWLNDRTLCAEGKINNNPMFIHQMKSMHMINNRLWQYYQEMKNKNATCAMQFDSINKSDTEDKFYVDTIKDNKGNAELIADLETKWMQFYNHTKHIM